MKQDEKIYVAGHTGMAGSAILRNLKDRGFCNIVCKTHAQLDLTDQRAVDDFLEQERPEYLFLAAARVGGIAANIEAPAEFLLDNLLIQCNVIRSAFRYGVKKLLFLGSSCIYPKQASQPIKEEYLLTGLMEPTNEGYAIAKVAGLKLCEYFRRQHGADFVSVMPCNLYGYHDNFDGKSSHIVPALMRKFHEAKVHEQESVTIWGTGSAYRELLFADDMADACVYVMEHYSGVQFLNMGYGKDQTVLEIANMIKEIVGYTGKIVTDPSKPEGMHRKLMDSSRLYGLGWRPRTTLQEGLRLTYEWFLSNVWDQNPPQGI